MIAGLALWLARKAAQKKPCPNCGAIYNDTASSARFEKPDYLVRCGVCGEETSLKALTQTQSADGAEAAALRDPRQPVPKPQGTRIGVMKLDDGSTAIDVPSARTSRGLLFFAIFWLGLSTVFFAGILFSAAGGDLPPLPAIGMLTLFEAIGLAMLYFALMLKYARHRILIRDEGFLYQREFFRRRRVHEYHTADISAVKQAVFYTQNYTPVYGIEIRTRNGRTIRLGSGLEDDEKRWLVWELRSALAAVGNTSVLPS